MSEQGQKIFKIAVWSVIFTVVAVYLIRLVILSRGEASAEENPPVTQSEWQEMLAEGFGDSSLTGDADEKKKVTGKEAAIAAVNAMGEDRVSVLMGKEALDDDARIEFAVDRGIIEKEKLDQELTREDANLVIAAAQNTSYDPANFPKYFETEGEKPIINANLWERSEYDQEQNIYLAEIEGELPQPGEIMLFMDQYGITHAKSVGEVKAASDDRYGISCESVEDLGQIADSIAFSGPADFGYLSGAYLNAENSEQAHHNPFVLVAHAEEKKEKWTTSLKGYVKSITEPIAAHVKNTIECTGKVIKGEKPFIEGIKDIADSEIEMREELQDKLIDDRVTIRLSENENEKCDIKFAVSVKESVDVNGKESQSVESYYTIKTEEGVSQTYKFTMKDGKADCSIVTEYDVFKDEKKMELTKSEDKKSEDKKTEDKEDEIYSGSDTASFSTSVSFTGFSVCADGYVQLTDPDDPKNCMRVVASADKMRIDATLAGSRERKIPFAELPIPVAVTGGVVSVNLKLYLVASVNGEVTIYYEMDNPFVGVDVLSESESQNGQRITFPHGHGDDRAGVQAKVEVSGGIVGTAAVQLFGENPEHSELNTVMEPGVDVRVYASAATFEPGDNYEWIEGLEGGCIKAAAQAPVIKLSLDAGNGAWLGKILKKLDLKSEVELVKKDSANVPWKAEYHVEGDEEGNVTFIQLEKGILGWQKQEEVCTHIRLKEGVVVETPTKTGWSSGISGRINDELNKKQADMQHSFEQLIGDWINQVESMFEETMMDSCSECY